MRTLIESVVTAMDGDDAGLYPFFPYIFQDLWEIGASPADVIELVRRHARKGPGLQALDLGCGKGAVSVRLAEAVGCACLGIDAVEDFVAEARRKAEAYGVGSLCRFEVGDIREKIGGLGRFDAVILGAIGPVFGDYRETLTRLSPHLGAGGIILIDDGYVEDGRDYAHPLMLKRGEMLRQIASAGMRLVDETVFAGDFVRDSDARIFDSIAKRCRELIEKHPGKRALFEGYLKKQEEENDVLEHKVIVSTMVIKAI